MQRPILPQVGGAGKVSASGIMPVRGTMVMMLAVYRLEASVPKRLRARPWLSSHGEAMALREGKLAFYRARPPQHPVVGTAPAGARYRLGLAGRLHDLGSAATIGRQTNDLCSQNVFFRAVAVSHHRFKLAAVAGRSTECSCARAFLSSHVRVQQDHSHQAAATRFEGHPCPQPPTRSAIRP